MLAQGCLDCRLRIDFCCRPLSHPIVGECQGCQHETCNDEPDHDAFECERVLWLIAEPRPLKHTSIPGKVDLIGALCLAWFTEDVDIPLVNGNGPILHLTIHEGPSRKLHESHQLVKIQRSPEVERNFIIVARALAAILHRKSTQRVGLGFGRITSANADTNGKVRFLEGDVNGTSLLASLLWEDVHGGLWRHAICWHIWEDSAPSCGRPSLHRQQGPQ